MHSSKIQNHLSLLFLHSFLFFFSHLIIALVITNKSNRLIYYHRSRNIILYPLIHTPFLVMNLIKQNTQKEIILISNINKVQWKSQFLKVFYPCYSFTPTNNRYFLFPRFKEVKWFWKTKKSSHDKFHMNKNFKKLFCTNWKTIANVDQLMNNPNYKHSWIVSSLNLQRWVLWTCSENAL